MKKIYSSVLLLVFTIAGFAQIPSGYYNNATGTGYTLKTQLYNIIKGHTDNGYAGLYTTYQTSDVDNFYENDGSVLDMYSENPSGTDPYNYSTGSTQRCGNYSAEGDCYNREHIIPQSVFDEKSPMVSDAHFITPTDGKVNGMRSNYPHGTVSSATYTSQNGSKLGSSGVSGYSGTVFEPINAFKGDIARMYFYFATRYENTVAGYSYAMFNGTSNQVFTTAFLNLLLTWNAQDPVSAREIARNNAVYGRQGNRNPYIDHPEYVNQIWGGTSGSGDTTAPSTPTSLASTAKTATSISLSWTASTDNVGVTGYDVYANSVLKTTVSGTTATITGLTASTSYSIYIKAKDAAGNASASSSTITITTNSSGGTGTATELLFSEYIEGSGNNKALEIANNTGNSISMSAYTIKKQTNGAGAWSTGLALTGTLSAGGKYVIVNSSISSSCFLTSVANISTTATELTFNGNDAVGLFKNGVLIDIIGTFSGGTANFAADVTLRRKSTVTAPTTTFNLSSQWDSYATDTCNNLASKPTKETKEEIVETPDDILIYPNPSDGNFTVSYGDSISYSIEIISFAGQTVFEKQNTSDNAVSVSHLSKGIYIVKVTTAEKTVIKKIIIN
ncbi:MAG: T9SS type A sorting domain-containing protein [Chryseobacterium sp.]|nr:MAG: T9SS type A sorting domain-containing protein [Chryseobacterium sp.]